MQLALDVGNTTIAIAVVDKKNVYCVDRVDSHLKKEMQNLQLLGILRGYQRRFGVFNRAIICSVVPRLSNVVYQVIKRELKIGVEIVGKSIEVPMINRYQNPRQVGQDRLVGAFAALKLYGMPVIVIDLGTAITFDAVSSKGEYLGGAIVPGIRLSAEALFLKTAMLPQINIQAPRSVIGRNTQDSILSGLFFGYGCLCRGFIDLMTQQVVGNPCVVMTGGHTQLMTKFIKGVNERDNKQAVRFKDLSRQGIKLGNNKKRLSTFIIDEHLVFKGLSLLLNG